MNKDYREFIKEALKTELELLKVFSVFLVALVSAVSSMALSDYLYKSTLHKILLLSGIGALIIVSGIFTIFVARIIKRLNQLKNNKS